MLKREKSFAATRRSEKPSSFMFDDLVKLAPPSLGGVVSDAVALPSVCAIDTTCTGCAEAPTGTASASMHAAKSAYRSLIPLLLSWDYPSPGAYGRAGGAVRNSARS